jgi:AraC-like DNA-binding protein
METLAPTLESAGQHVVLYHLITEGCATAHLDGQPDAVLEAGDVVVFPHGHAHRVWHGRPRAWYDTGPAVRRALQGDLQVSRSGGTGVLTRFVCGYFSCERQAGHLFLAGLPPLLKVTLRGDRHDAWLEDAIRFLGAEAASDHPGRLALMAKLSEALFVETLRRCMTTLPDQHAGWLAAARDPVTGHALAVLHREPARPWTIERLAHEVGASRSTLVERFSHFLQEAPMTYLARWRLQLGARYLETTHRSVLEVAGDVGYESEAAFNRAFRREFGLPPGRYRRQGRSSPARTQSRR